MTDRYFAGLATLLAGVSAAAMVLVPAVASAQAEPAGYYQDEPTPVAYQAPPVSQYQSLPPPQYTSPPAPRYQSPPAPQYQSPPAPQYQSPPAPQYQSPPAPQYQSPPAPQYQSPPAPQAQYAPAAAPANEADYNNWLYRQAMRDYHARYAQWRAQTEASQAPAGQNCESQRNTNVAAGAIFGGVAGALLGVSLAGWAVRGAWALFGGSVGLTAGAILGASATPESCEHRYAAVSRAPRYYEGEAYGRPAYAAPRRWSEDRGYGYRGYGAGQYYPPPPPRYARPPAYPGYWQQPGPYDRY